MAWVDKDWPGWIRVRLVDAVGREWFVVDTVPIFYADFGPDAAMPTSVGLGCDIVGQDGDRVVIEPRWRNDRFRVQRGWLQPVRD